VYAALLALGGYVSTDQPAGWNSRTQPDSAVLAITLGFSLVPALLVLLSLLPLRGYSLDATEVER
jgi:Na+/melibiose symporter-like transporter